MPVQRGYRQACGIARGLDIVGERWSLLVVRELLLGPKRFTDLQQALPAASPNALAGRLRELTGAGVVLRRQLPAAVWVYELTPWGRGLEPVILALGTWALASPPAADQVFVSADSVMLAIRTYFRPATEQRVEGETVRIELRDRGPAGVFGVTVGSDGVDVSPGPPRVADAVLATTTEALLAAFGDDDLTALAAAGARISGDTAALRRLLKGVRVPGPSAR